MLRKNPQRATILKKKSTSSLFTSNNRCFTNLMLIHVRDTWVIKYLRPLEEPKSPRNLANIQIKKRMNIYNDNSLVVTLK